MFCGGLCQPIFLVIPCHWREFWLSASMHCLHRQQPLLPIGSPAPLFSSLIFYRIWLCEEKLAVETSLGESKLKPCFTKQYLRLLLRLVLGLIDWPKLPTLPWEAALKYKGLWQAVFVMKITHTLVNPPCVSYSITYLTGSSVSVKPFIRWDKCPSFLPSVAKIIKCPPLPPSKAKAAAKSFCEVIGICGKIGVGYIVL